MDRTTYDIAEVRSRICNLLLVVASIAAVPALAASLYRITAVGWMPVMAVHAGLTLGLWLVALFRHRLPYNLRAGYIVTGCALVGLGDLWHLGLQGAYYFAVLAPAFCAILFGTRAGVVILVASLLIAGVIGLGTASELRVPLFDPTLYAKQPASWIAAIAIWAFAAATLLAAVVTYNKGLSAALDETSQHEAALRRSEARFRGLFENSANAISLKDVTGRYLLVNPQFETLMGLRGETVIGKTSNEIFDRAFAESGMEQDREAIDRKQTVRTDELFDRGDRTLRFLTTKFPIFGEDGEVIAVAGVHTDLTERMEAEDALRQRESDYRQLVELSPDAVIVQCDGRIVLANRSATAMFGAGSVEAMIGRDSLSIVHPDFRDLIFGLRSHVLEQQSTVAPTPTRHLRLDGISFDSEFTAGPIEWNGRPATINLIRDVSERKITEQQLQQALKMEAVGQLTGGVAHDFNNLLAIILGNAELLSAMVGKEHKAEVEPVIRAARRGADLTRRLLAFSRRQVLEPKIINAHGIVTDMIGLLRRTLGEDIEIATLSESDLWSCEIDPAQFENALVNLAVNSRDAMPDGGKLTIQTANVRLDHGAAARAEVTPGQYVLVSISDTGKGMTPEVREKVFDPFFTTKDVGKGTGLGLSMIYGFVKQSGGHVAIDSKVGEGTTVELYLPRSEGEQMAVENRRDADGVVHGAGEVVLVVEDDADMRAMTIAMLRSLGYGVLEAATAKGALEILEKDDGVNLLLTDVVLPGGSSGRALAEKARKRAPDLAVLHMSGYTEDTITRHGRLDEGVRLLRKPFHKTEIARAVRSALESVPRGTKGHS
jgi:PAS domain S-box-containing protein